MKLVIYKFNTLFLNMNCPFNRFLLKYCCGKEYPLHHYENFYGKNPLIVIYCWFACHTLITIVTWLVCNCLFKNNIWIRSMIGYQRNWLHYQYFFVKLFKKHCFSQNLTLKWVFPATFRLLFYVLFCCTAALLCKFVMCLEKHNGF